MVSTGSKCLEGIPTVLDSQDISTPQVADKPGKRQEPTLYQRSAGWEPVYRGFEVKVGGGPVLSTDDEGAKTEDLTNIALPSTVHHNSKMELPSAWRCPCGKMVYGSSCSCGRLPRDSERGRLDSSQRCTTGRQGRQWKKISRRS